MMQVFRRILVPHDFSTAHGAWETGVAAADAWLQARGLA